MGITGLIQITESSREVPAKGKKSKNPPSSSLDVSSYLTVPVLLWPCSPGVSNIQDNDRTGGSKPGLGVYTQVRFL